MADNVLRNRPFEELRVGDTASLVRMVGHIEIDLLAAMIDGSTPTRIDMAPQATAPINNILADGLWTGSLVSAVLGARLPGPGTVYLEQDFRFVKPVTAGDRITATVRVAQKIPENRTVILETTCSNQKGEFVLTGTATVMAPDREVQWTETSSYGPSSIHAGRYDAFVREARSLPPVRAAIIHPCSAGAILAAVEVREEGLFEPLLIGPEAKIRAAADAAKVDLGDIAIEDVPHSHAAAARAVELAVCGAVSVLVKGSLHTDELLGAVIAPGSGLRVRTH